MLVYLKLTDSNFVSSNILVLHRVVVVGVIVNAPHKFTFSCCLFLSIFKIRVENIWDMLKLRLVFVMIGVGFTITTAVL